MQVLVTIQKLLAGNNLYYPVQSQANRHVCGVINFYDIHHFELSTGDVIMNIAVLFSLHFAENMLNMS